MTHLQQVLQHLQRQHLQRRRVQQHVAILEFDFGEERPKWKGVRSLEFTTERAERRELCDACSLRIEI